MKKLSVEIEKPEHSEKYVVLKDKDVTVYLDKTIRVPKDDVNITLSKFLVINSLKVEGISY